MRVLLSGFKAISFHHARLPQAQFKALDGLFIALQQAFFAADYRYASRDSYGLVAERRYGEQAIGVHFSVSASGQHRLSALVAATELEFFALAQELGLDMAVINEMELAARMGAAMLDELRAQVD